MQSIPLLEEDCLATQAPKLNRLLIGQDIMALNFKEGGLKT